VGLIIILLYYYNIIYIVRRCNTKLISIFISWKSWPVVIFCQSISCCSFGHNRGPTIIFTQISIIFMYFTRK